MDTSTETFRGKADDLENHREGCRLKGSGSPSLEKTAFRRNAGGAKVGLIHAQAVIFTPDYPFNGGFGLSNCFMTIEPRCWLKQHVAAGSHSTLPHAGTSGKELLDALALRQNFGAQVVLFRFHADPDRERNRLEPLQERIHPLGGNEVRPGFDDQPANIGQLANRTDDLLLKLDRKSVV